MGEEALLSLVAALLGAIAGSFLNALSFRFNTGRGIVWEGPSTALRASRSRCMHCGHTLSAADLVPIFSFLFLRGRCRYCGSKISWQYPLVEAAAAALSVLIFFAHAEPVTYAFWFVVWMTLLFVVIYDIRHGIIPWSCSILLGVLALVYLVVTHAGLAGFSAGPALALPLLLLSLVSGGRWMGWGDGALELGLGWLLGLTAGLTALVLAFWSGALVGIALMVATKKVTMKSEMPFAPFLVLGAFVALSSMLIFSRRLGRYSKKKSPLTQAGFTLIELLVVISIMVVITAGMLLNQSRFDSSTLLRSLAYSTALSVRQAQIYGSSVLGTATSQASCIGGFYNSTLNSCYANAYGLEFVYHQNYYILFADLDNNGRYTTGTDATIKTFTFNNGYTIADVCDSGGASACGSDGLGYTTFDVVFKRPNPEACFSNNSVAHVNDCLPPSWNPLYTSMVIKLASQSDPLNTRSVTVTQTGEIAVCSTVGC